MLKPSELSRSSVWVALRRDDVDLTRLQGDEALHARGRRELRFSASPNRPPQSPCRDDVALQSGEVDRHHAQRHQTLLRDSSLGFNIAGVNF